MTNVSRFSNRDLNSVTSAKWFQHQINPIIRSFFWASYREPGNSLSAQPLPGGNTRSNGTSLEGQPPSSSDLRRSQQLRQKPRQREKEGRTSQIESKTGLGAKYTPENRTPYLPTQTPGSRDRSRRKNWSLISLPQLRFAGGGVSRGRNQRSWEGAASHLLAFAGATFLSIKLQFYPNPPNLKRNNWAGGNLRLDTRRPNSAQINFLQAQPIFHGPILSSDPFDTPPPPVDQSAYTLHKNKNVCDSQFMEQNDDEGNHGLDGFFHTLFSLIL